MDLMQVKHCSACDADKPLDEFNRDRAQTDGRKSRCRSCRSKARVGQYAALPEASREANRERLRREHEGNREAVLGHYGRSCTCCGTAEHLTIDHVNGDGRRHREQIGHGGAELYRWLVANGFPEGFQTLCRPCNKSKGNGQLCRLQHARAGAR
jgi:hypothetical protein